MSELELDNTAGKRGLPAHRLIVKRLRITQGHLARLAEYRALHEGKSEADGLRDVLNAGFRQLLPAAAPRLAA